jgi:hypothetical protein
MKNGRTHLTHKTEHAINLDTGAIVGVTVQGADEGDTTTIHETLPEAVEQLEVAAVTNDAVAVIRHPCRAACARSRILLVAIVAFALIGIADAARAQTTTGTFFAGGGEYLCCGDKLAALEIGGGAEVDLSPHFGLGADVGLVSGGDITRPLPSGATTYYFGRTAFLSARVIYHLSGALRASHLRPLVAAGVGFKPVSGWTVAAGFDWWLVERTGVRFELNDQVLGEFGTTHLVVARVGLIIR